MFKITVLSEEQAQALAIEAASVITGATLDRLRARLEHLVEGDALDDIAHEITVDIAKALDAAGYDLMGRD